MTNNKELTMKFMRIEKLSHRVYSNKMRMGRMPADPMRGQGRVLAILKLQDNISQKDLAYLLQMRQQSLSELLNKLEAKGYVRKEVSPEDARSNLYSLTEEGRLALDEIQENEEHYSAFSALTPEEKETMSIYMDKILADLEKQEKDMIEAGDMPPHQGHGPCGRGPGKGPHGNPHDQNRSGSGAPFQRGFYGYGKFSYVDLSRYFSHSEE